jgi:hypothetical protein
MKAFRCAAEADRSRTCAPANRCRRNAELARKRHTFPEVNGCIDLNVSFAPSTTLLQVRRLTLPMKNQQLSRAPPDARRATSTHLARCDALKQLGTGVLIYRGT